MPVKRRIGKRRAGVPAVVLALLNDEAVAPGDEFDAMLLDHPLGISSDGGPGLADYWRDLGDGIVRRWADRRPGTRPRSWWRWSAPEPRRRLGGTGTPSHEVLANELRLVCGVPADWILGWEVGVYGKRFRRHVVDPDDPPTFESQASFLDRNHLFLPGERARLREADFTAEAIALPDDDEAD